MNFVIKKDMGIIIEFNQNMTPILWGVVALGCIASLFTASWVIAALFVAPPTAILAMNCNLEEWTSMAYVTAPSPVKEVEFTDENAPDVGAWRENSPFLSMSEMIALDIV